MRVNPAQINAYTRKIDRPLAQTSGERDLMGALGRGVDVLDLTTARGSAQAARSLPAHRPDEGGGSIQGVLTPEESRFIAALFPHRESADAKAGQVYTHAGRPMPGAVPGIRLDLKA